MILLSLLFVAMMPADQTFKPGDYDRSIKVGELNRSYLLHIPPGYRPEKPTPVVLAFHGGGANAENMKVFSGLNKTADREGFIVVYPNGSGRLARMLTFNAGNCCAYAMTNDIDDVGFTRKLLDDLEKVVNVDKKRIYATGMSNGAMMCYRLAAELSDRIAAIAPVSGPVGQASVNPGRAVSVLHFHGTADEFAPLGGGAGKGLSGTDFYSVDYSLRLWVKANGCQAEPVVEKMADRAKDGTAVTRKTFSQGKQGAEVVLIEIQGGGHTWPGQSPRMQSLGKSTKNISANDVMWEFFQKHPMK